MKLFFPRGAFAAIKHLLFPRVYDLYKLGDNSRGTVLGHYYTLFLLLCYTGFNAKMIFITKRKSLYGPMVFA